MCLRLATWVHTIIEKYDYSLITASPKVFSLGKNNKEWRILFKKKLFIF